MSHPSAPDYLQLFATHGRDFGDVYLDPTDDRYRELFEQACRLLLQESDFNRSMPQEFRRTARQWTEGDLATLNHMSDAQNRHFMLSDLYDYVHLRHAMGGPGW